MTARFLCAFAVCCLGNFAYAQKKPVTLEVAASYRPPEQIVPIWAPDGERFLRVEGQKLHLFDCRSRTSKVLASLREIEGKAKASWDGQSTNQWRNRRVAPVKPQWSPDGSKIFAESGGDLFLLDVASGAWTQLTATPEAEEDPRISPDGRRAAYRIRNDLYGLELSGAKPRRLTSDGSATLLNGGLDWVYPEELALARAWWWSPDSTQIAFLQFDVSAETIHPHVDSSPIEAVYEPQRFPKAGTPNAKVRLGVVSARGGRVRWMDTGPSGDTLIARVEWMPGGKELAVQRLSRIQDRLDLLAVNAATGKSRTLVTETDPAWINVHDILHFYSESKFLWASERDGHRHLYLYENGASRQLTAGPWEAVNLAGADEKQVWFVSTKESVLERHLYRLEIKTGALDRLTKQAGTHSIAMSPKNTYYLDHWQSHVQTPRQSLHSQDGEEVYLLKDSGQTEYDLLPSEYLTFNGKDGTLFHAQLIKPKNFQPARRYPAIVMVYGGPHAQTVRDTWGGPNWEQALAQRGYAIWRMDNRGSNYRGHAFETPLHRQLGKRELADQLEGVEHLLQLGFVDASRVGIYGWSYGGYMTLYALTHAPKVFAAGVAGAPVTDWRHYDTIYTERYMGLPSRNEEGYKAASPVHAATRVEAKLLIVHNFQDDNVLFQNSQQMMAALQTAGKQFESMFYTLKSHGVTGPLKLHLLQTVTGFFDRHLSP